MALIVKTRRTGFPSVPSVIIWKYVLYSLLALLNLITVLSLLCSTSRALRRRSSRQQSFEGPPSRYAVDRCVEGLWVCWLRTRGALSFYNFVDLSAGVLLFIAAIHGICEQHHYEYDLFTTEKTSSVVKGLGLLFCYLGLLRYFEHSRRLSFFSLNFQLAIGPAFWLVVATVPIFLGFAGAGTILFGTEAPNFASFGRSCTTLFAMSFGDELNETVAGRRPRIRATRHNREQPQLHRVPSA